MGQIRVPWPSDWTNDRCAGALKAATDGSGDVAGSGAGARARVPAVTVRPEGPPRALVVDDDELLRRAVADALRRGGIQVVGTASDGREGIELAVHYRPDVLVVDLMMPGIDGVGVTEAVAARAPEVRILLLTGAAPNDAVKRALWLGASGFLNKTSLPRLAEVVHQLAQGMSIVEPTMIEQLLAEFRRMPDDGSGVRPVDSALTSREWQVLDALVAGRDTTAIADGLDISVGTVRNHLKRAYRKLGVHSREEAIAEVRRMRGFERTP